MEKGNIIAPDRLFFHNLSNMLMLHYKDEELVDQANSLVERAIKKELNLIKHHVEKGISLPRDFKKYANDEVINYAKKRPGGTKHFFLIKCLSRIKKCSQLLEGPEWSNSGEISQDENDDSLYIVDELKKAIDQLLGDGRASLFSPKTLCRLKRPDERAFDRDQLDAIEFLIGEVFPSILSKEVVEELATQSWEKLVLYIGNEQKLYYEKSDVDTKIIEEQFQKILRAYYEDENCGSEMIFFFRQVRKLHKKLIPIEVYVAIKTGIRNDNPPLEKVSIETEPEGYTDEKLSHQILSFVRWLPIQLDDEQNDYKIESMNRLDAVSNIIDVVRNSFISSISQLPKGDPPWEDCSSGGFFARADGTLRQELITALTQEKYFCDQFKRSYGLCC